MQRALRPYVTAGVAVIGASLIVATPVLAPGIEQRAAEVELAAVVPPDPFIAYPALITNTFGNLSNLAGQVFADPFPILSQIFTNQLGYASAIGTSGLTYVQDLITYFTTTGPGTFIGGVQQGINEIMAGNIHDGIYQIFFIAPLSGPLLDLLFSGLITAINDALNTMADNVGNAVHALTSASLVLSLSLIAPFASVVDQVGYIGQYLYDDAQAGDLVGIANTLISTPALLLNAPLNGSDPPGFPGILSPVTLGPIQELLNLRTAIATAIDPPMAPALSTLAGDITSGLSPAALVQNLTAALDAGNLAALVNPADLAAAIGPALTAIADIPATLMSLIP